GEFGLAEAEAAQHLDQRNDDREDGGGQNGQTACPLGGGGAFDGGHAYLRHSFAVSTRGAQEGSWGGDGTVVRLSALLSRYHRKDAHMTDPTPSNPIEQTLEEEVETNRALEQGLGVGARELAAI